MSQDDTSSMIGKRDDEIRNDFQGERLHDLKKRVIETGKSEDLDMISRTQFGYKYYKITVDALRDDDGQIFGASCVQLNISRYRYAPNQSYKDDDIHDSELGKHSILPLCSFCKNVRNKYGQWEAIDSYIVHHSKLSISHGICPDCLKNNYSDIYERIKSKI